MKNSKNVYLKKISLLYVEDNDEARRLLSKILIDECARLFSASNGREALRIVKENKIDVILSDISMPDMDGITMTENLKKSKRNIPVIFITAYSDEESLLKAIELGVQKYIKKPVNIDMLLELLEETAKNFIQDSELQIKNNIIDSIEEGVITSDANLTVNFCNHSALNILKLKKSEELIGKKIQELFENPDDKIASINKALNNAKSVYNIRTRMAVNNCAADVSMNISPLNLIEGQTGGIIIAFRDVSELIRLQNELIEKFSFQNIIAKSKKMIGVMTYLKDYAESDATVLITGENGSGKELIADALHNLSRRKNKPYVKINCAAIPETLLESELFGYKKGAFTDAKTDKPGKFKLAEGGTMLLDEIGELSLKLQSKILRMIQNKEYDMLGDSKTCKADVRIIAATNKNLKRLISEKTFREDLFYRLSVINIHIPPLRERLEDIPLLVRHIINVMSAKYNKIISGADYKYLKILLNYNYPGNIRELQNIIEHSVILCRKNRLSPDLLPEYLNEPKPFILNNQQNEKENFRLLNQEQKRIIEILQKNKYNKIAAAAELQIDRTTLWRRLKKIETITGENF
ncbi:MAG TPA: sigma 54-interacting transcriptional regulator [bacterium]|nr:sigma 54-interacting transcriptional regulator [bacterium]HPN30916.1 sigma 54-interacting transcriptional regulator [bacterium]